MPETVKTDEDLELIKVTSYGEVTEENLRRSRCLVSDLLHAGGFTRVFVDASMLTTLPSTNAVFTHSVGLSSAKIPRNTKFAIAISRKTKTDSIFLETAALNRGVIIKNFESKDDALAWLME